MYDLVKQKIAALYAKLQLKFPENGEFFNSIVENFLPQSPIYQRHGRELEKIEYDVEQLVIDSSLSENYIQSSFDDYNIIPLRHVDPTCDTLIIGCGNYPLSDS
ncbi:MAG: hypothetical protein ACRCXC_05705 [Legionella sp.]